MSKKTASSQSFLLRLKSYLGTQRSFLAGSYGEYLLVIIALLVITSIFTDFVIFNLFDRVFTERPGDATAGFLWLNFADPSLNPIVQKVDWTNYPDGQYVTNFSFITYLFLWLPLRILSFVFGPVASLTIVTYIGFISAGLSMYWLLKRLTGSWYVAFFAGYATAFVPYAVVKGSTHLAYIFSYVFVLMIAGFMALWLRPTKLRAVLLGLVTAVAFYTDGYYILLASVMMFGLVLAGALYSVFMRMPKQEFWQRVKMLCITAAVVIVAVLPIAVIQLTKGGQIQQALSESRPDIAKEIVAYRSNVIDFILPAPTHPAFESDPLFQSIHNYKNQRSNGSENLNYVAFTLMALVAVGMVLLTTWLLFPKYSSVRKLPQPMMQRYVLLGAITVVVLPLCLAFMFSPEVSVFGRMVTLPGKFLIDLDLALWRVMSRFFVVFHVVVVAFAAFTLWVIIRQLGYRKRLVGIGIVMLCCLLVVFEYASAPHQPAFSFQKMPKVYHWLAKQRDIKVIAEFPVVDPLDGYSARYFTAQVVHKKKLVNKKDPDSTRLSNVVGGVDNPEAIDWAYRRGADAAITYGKNCTPKPWGTLLFSDDIHRSKKWCVYRLERPISQDSVFVHFDKGFTYINTDRKKGDSVALKEGAATMRFVEPNLITPAKGKVIFSAALQPYGHISMKRRWRLLQNGQEIATGGVEDSRATINATAEAEKPLILEVTRGDGHPLIAEDLKISDVIVSRSDQ